MPTMTPATAGAPYRVPTESSRWPSLALAAGVHAGLLLFLWVGISWQNTAPVAVEAELWDIKTEAAAAPPLPAEAPAPTPPAPTPPAPPVEAPPVEKVVAPKAPDIALEKAKRKAEKLAQQREDEAERRELEKRELKAREKADKLLAEKAEKADKLRAEKAAADKFKADKLAKAKLEAAEQKKLDQLREAEMRRIMGAAGAGGNAQKSTAPRIDSGYLASITSKIKSTTSYAGSTDLAGNPRVVFKIEELPTGEIMSVKLVKSSGVPGFDDAVEKGIIKSSPLPKKKDGTVERTLEIAFSMKDLN
jgi:colicin import membrane protein